MKCVKCKAKDTAIANTTFLLNKIIENLEKDANFVDTVKFNKENILNNLKIQLEEIELKENERQH